MDLISRQVAIDGIIKSFFGVSNIVIAEANAIQYIKRIPPAKPKIIMCKECKHWRQQTNYNGDLLSFGFCDSDDMWRSLYGETYEVAHIDTEDNFYCGYAEEKIDE